MASRLRRRVASVFSAYGRASGAASGTVVGSIKNLPPVWVTGNPFTAYRVSGQWGTYQLSATDPEGQAITYSAGSPALPAGWVLPSNGLLQIPPSTAVGRYFFGANASDGVSVTSFIFTVDVADNTAPAWTTAASFSITQGTTTYQLVATDPDAGQTLTYSLQSGSTLPSGWSLSSSGLLTIPSNAAVQQYPAFTVLAGDGFATTARTFTVTVSASSVRTAASASQADVQAAINAASAGDTVQVPAGSGTWAGLTISKAISLVGAGIGLTNITLGTGNSITKQAAGITRLRGFTFSRTSGGITSKAITIDGSWLSAEPVVIEDCEFQMADAGLFELRTLGVVFAKCRWVTNSSAGGSTSMLKLNFDQFIGGSTAGYAASWLEDDTLGSRDTDGKRNVYIEDCYIVRGQDQPFDFDNGSRVVCRYNRLDLGSFNSHGLDTSGIGERHWEFYNNQFRFNSALTALGLTQTSPYANISQFIWLRGGTGVIYNNQIEDISSSEWGSKPEVRADIRAVQDGSGSAYGDFSDGRAWRSAGTGTYPRQHQLAVNRSSSVGTNGGYYIDPIYMWGNTGTGSNGSGGILAIGEGSWGSQTGYFNSGRDYFNGGSAKPGYTAYTYPHPLRVTTGQAY